MVDSQARRAVVSLTTGLRDRDSLEDKGKSAGRPTELCRVVISYCTSKLHASDIPTRRPEQGSCIDPG